MKFNDIKIVVSNSDVIATMTLLDILMMMLFIIIVVSTVTIIYRDAYRRYKRNGKLLVLLFHPMGITILLMFIVGMVMMINSLLY